VGAAPASSHDGAGALARQQPLVFEANHGQTDPQVHFVARGAGYTAFLTETEAVLVFAGGAEHAVVRLKPVNASPTPHLVGDESLPGVANYSQGVATASISAPTYARVRYGEVYPGIDLVYYGRLGELEYDFVVAPGADPGRIAMAFEGAERLEVGADGALVLRTAAGALRQSRPVVYQEVDGARRTVSADYVIDGDGRVGFRLGAYDASRRLVIDPVLSYSTYLGGSNDEGDSLWGAAFGIAVDAAGNIYVSGTTSSVDFPTTPGAKRTLDGDQDAFVTKLSPSGAVLYSTYLGGPCGDVANDVAVDAAGNAYVTGRANVLCFMSLDRSGVLVAKLGPTGSPVYALVFGGMYADTSVGEAIAVDAQGRAYVTGTATTADFPTTPGAFRTLGCSDLGLPGYGDGFVAKVSPAGALEYSTFLCGSGYDAPYDIALDAAGNIVIAGTTGSGDFVTSNPLQATSGTHPTGRTGFVSKLAAAGTHLIYSTYLGGTINDWLVGVAVDGQGNVYVTGETESTDFPTTPGTLQPQRGNLFCLSELCTDAFVSKINAAGSALVYSTYLYGEGDDGGRKIAVDTAGNAYVVGQTASLHFPIRDAFQAASRVRGPTDAFVAKLNANGTKVLHSSYLGGSGGASPLTGADEAVAVAVDAAGNAYVAGSTRSFDLPTTPGAFQSAIGGGVCDYFGGPCGDAFIAKVSAGGPGPTAPTRVSVTPDQVVPGGTLEVGWALPNPTATDHLILYTLGSTSETYVAWWATGGGAAGTLALALPANLADGTYEIRLLTPDPGMSGLLQAVARSQPVRVAATASCGLGPEMALALPLLRLLRRRLRRRSWRGVAPDQGVEVTMSQP